MELAVLIKFFSNIWVRRACVVLGILLALWAFGEYKQRQGKQEGQHEQQSQTADQSEQLRKQDRKELDDKFAALLPIVQDSHQKVEKLETAIGAKDALILALVQRRQEASTQVAGMTEPQVAELIAKYSPRQVADCVTQYPMCQQQVKEQNLQIDNLSNDIAETRRGNQATVDLFNGLKEYNTQLERDYTSLFNAQSPKRRSAKCLFLWHCTQKLIPYPSPLSLKNPLK